MIKRLEVGPRMSRIVVHGNIVYLAGVVPDDEAADVAGQATQVLSKIDKLLAQAGTDKSKALSAMVWLSDIKYFDAFNAVWDAWVSQGNTPARACVESKLAKAGFKVEVGITAAL